MKNTMTPAAMIAARQAHLGLTDQQLATALGYESDRVVAMMKSGTMRVPVNKVRPLAQALQVDHFDLLRLVLTESAPELWDEVQQVAPLGALQPAEVNLLRHLRRLRGDREVKPVVFDGKAVIALVAVA